MASDSANVESLYNKLIARGLTVWWDKICLQPGKLWEDGFCDGLVSSRAFVCLLSKQAIAHPTNTRQSFSSLTSVSACDNVLLEHQLALEFLSMGLLDFVFPVFIGEIQPAAVSSAVPILSNFDFSATSNMPDTSVTSISSKLIYHMDRQCLGQPLIPERTVKATMQLITSFQGGFVSGDADDAFTRVSDSILKMCAPVSAPTPLSQVVPLSVGSIPVKAGSVNPQMISAAELVLLSDQLSQEVQHYQQIPKQIDDLIKELHAKLHSAVTIIIK